MGVDLYIGTERDVEKLVCLSRPFTWAMFEPFPALHQPGGGLLWGWMSPAEREDLFRGSDAESPDPAEWSSGDPVVIGAILRKLRARLEAENDRLPVMHLLSYVEADRQHRGTSSLYIPARPEIDEARSDGPFVRLEGQHGDAAHRMDLRRFRVWVAPGARKRHEALSEKMFQDVLARHNIKPGEEYAIGWCPPELPLEEEPDGWIPVQPTLEVAGRRIAVRSVDKLAWLGPDLDQTIEHAERAVAGNLPLFWSVG